MTEKTTGPDNATQLLKRLAPALQDARQQLESIKRRTHEPVAIVSMGLRFPGADSPEAFWELLEKGEDKVKEVPPDRWAVDDFFDPQPGRPDKMYIREAAFLDEVDQFDAAFFDVSPREAASLDPQHRMLLEVAWEAFERSGVGPKQLTDSRTGVFVGMSENDYARLENTGDLYNVYATTGNSNYFAAGRLSYLLGLKGPNMIVDTACSGSLVAVHLACQSLRQGECDMALAGGIQLMLLPDPMIATAQLNAFAPDGRCKTFDASADGYGRGEGCGVIVLKRLSDAVDAGDTILSVLRGGAVNHGGRGSGLTSPNKSAQEELLHQALKNARVKPEDVSYIEAHGTGTQLGDPIEVGALNHVFADSRSEPLWIGSVKSNIGHLEPASGIAGLIKVVLALQEKKIPPSLHFHNPNPLIDWDNSPVKVPTECIPWTESGRVAGVSSFGMSGTNCSVIVGEPPAVQRTESSSGDDRPEHLFTLSAKNAAALGALVNRYTALLRQSPTTSLADLCYSANTGRYHFNHRLSVSARDVNQLAEQLEGFPHKTSDRLFHAVVADHQLSPSVAFLFTGQGSQYPGMGHELYRTQPVFRRIMDECDQALQLLLGKSIINLLYGSSDANNRVLDQTIYTQPCLFALEYAIARLWESWGVEPDVVLGHSVGEYAAACLAGVFSLEDGLKLITARARLMQALPAGKMLSVRSREQDVETIIAPFRKDVSIAAINGSHSVVVSGQSEAIDRIAEQLTAKGVSTQFLAVSHAFHSPMMSPMLGAFQEIANTITYHRPRLALISNVTGRLISDDIATPEYWVKHVREAVRFSDGIVTLQEQKPDILLEIGPRPVLSAMVKQIFSENDLTSEPLMLPSLREPGRDWQSMLAACGQLYIHKAEIDWVSFDTGYSRNKCLLPTYPFQRKRYWVDPSTVAKQRSVVINNDNGHSEKVVNLLLDQQMVFETEFSLQTMPYMIDHKIMGEVVVPGACYVSMMLKTAQQIFPDAAHEIKDVIFHQPIVFGTGAKYTVQTIVGMEDSPHHKHNDLASTRTIKVVSFPAMGGLDAESKVHATGSLSVLDAAEPIPAVLGDLQKQCPRSISHDQWYHHIVKNRHRAWPFFWVDRRALARSGRISGSAAPASMCGQSRREPPSFSAAGFLPDRCGQYGRQSLGNKTAVIVRLSQVI